MAASLLCWPGLGPAQSPEAIRSLYTNTLVCQDIDTHAVCHAWFDPDGHYYIFYDLGPQTRPATTQGPFQFEGREGVYSARSVVNGVQLCLRPLAPIAITAAANRELFTERECYTVVLGALGSRWEQADSQGRRVVMWLMAGR